MTWLAAFTDAENTGPKTSSAPSFRADFAAFLAPLAVPLVSFGIRVKLLWAISNNAICAAFSMDLPSFSYFPLNGNNMATFTWGKLDICCSGAPSGWRSTALMEMLAGVCCAEFCEPVGCWVSHGLLLYPPDETQADNSKMNNMEASVEAIRIYLLFSHLLFLINLKGLNMDNTEKVPLNPDSNITLRGGLYIVSTPIGNLRDISLRGLDVLRAADIIMCEDTRVTRKLLGAYQIKARLNSYNDHSDDARRENIIEQVKEGKAIALVSDAGMPLISDPGYKLVRDAQACGVYVTTIPGANAPLAALQLSGLPSDQFCFLGFLPNKSGARQKMLAPWKSVPATLICFTSAPRLIASIEDISAALKDREIAVVREITKLYEEVRKGATDELISYYQEHGLPKGEIVLVIAPPIEEGISDEAIYDMIRIALKTMRTKEAAGFVAGNTGLKKNDLYNIALEINSEIIKGDG